MTSVVDPEVTELAVAVWSRMPFDDILDT